MPQSNIVISFGMPVNQNAERDYQSESGDWSTDSDARFGVSERGSSTVTEAAEVE